MLTCNSALSVLLDAAADKADWASILNAALGTSKRVRCFQTIGSVTVEFRNVAISNAVSMGNAGLLLAGTAFDTTASAAADLTQGTSVLRIEGNGHYIQGSFGLSGTDFIADANFTETNGFANRGIAIAPPAALPNAGESGDGGGDASTAGPHKITIEDWTSGVGVDVGDIVFDAAMPNQVFQDTEIAANLGTLKVTKSSQKVVFGGIEFGSIRWEYPASVNSEANEPMYQVVTGMKPSEANWPGYPAYAGYINKDGLGAGTTTQPSAFKVAIKSADGTVLFRHEMPKDGLPINHPSLSQNVTETMPLRQFMNCAQMLEWKSARPKMNTFAHKYFPGVEADALRPTIFKQKVSTNQAHGIFRTNQNVDSAGQWFGMPKWGYPAHANNKDTDPNADAYLFSIDTEYAPWFTINSGVVRATGWGYEPGGTTGHDMMTGPGGVRVDRAAIPMPIAIYMTNPDFVRPKGGESIQEMLDHWMKGYWNHSQHYIHGDVRDFGTVPKQEVTGSVWSFSKTYYGTNESYTAGGLAKAIPQFVMGIGGSTPFLDKNGLKPFNGNGIDMLHNYVCPGWGGLLFNDAGLIYSQVHRYLGSIMCQLSEVNLSTDLAIGSPPVFNGRQLAWRYLHYVMMWKLASDHPLGISRAMVEERFEAELDAVYTYVYQRIKDPANPNYNHQQIRALRNLGCSVQPTRPFFNAMTVTAALTAPSTTVQVNDVFYYQNALTVAIQPVSPENPRTVMVGPNGTVYTLIGVATDIPDTTARPRPGTLTFSTPVQVVDAPLNGSIVNTGQYTFTQATAGQAFYMAHVLQLMRQTGMWSVMRAKSDQCFKALGIIIECLDKLSIDFILDTDGTEESYVPLCSYAPGDNIGLATVVDSWAHSASLRPKVGSTDWVTNADGTNKLEVDISQHNRAQWPFIRRDYFPDVPCERANGIALACAKYRGFYDTHDARLQAVIDSGATAITQRNNDWTYRMAPLGIIKPATALGPA